MLRIVVPHSSPGRAQVSRTPAFYHVAQVALAHVPCRSGSGHPVLHPGPPSKMSFGPLEAHQVYICVCVWGGCRYSKDLTLHFMGTSVHSPKVALPQPRPAKGTESRAGDQGWGVTQAHQTRPWWPRGGGRRSPVTRDGVSSVSLSARARQPSCALVPAGFTHRIITAGITHNCQERLGHRKTVSYNCPFALHQ